MNIVTCGTFVAFILNCVLSLNIRSPPVYIVTPASITNFNEGRSAPFYNHNWIRRIDSLQNSSTTTMPKTKTPDLIFAEFESGSGDNNMQKSIRKLLEKESVKQITIATTPSTTSQSIYFANKQTTQSNGSTSANAMKQESSKSESDPIDYFAMYNNLYNNPPAPIYSPSMTTTTTSTSTTAPSPSSIENIWHIINSEKSHQFSGNWEEVPINSNNQDNQDSVEVKLHNHIENELNTGENPVTEDKEDTLRLQNNISNGAENESRAIRTEPNIRFPYVSLKPFQMKKTSLTDYQNSKKSNNMFTNLDNFKEINNPVRGEAQDTISSVPLTDRYNPAQPYLPQDNKSKIKQVGPPRTPTKAVANLVPPPPPPPPKITGDDFPVPPNYDSFPPYALAPSAVDIDPVPSLPLSNPSTSIYQVPKPSYSDTSPISDDDANMPVNMGYRYKPLSFLPTVPPVSKPFHDFLNEPSNEDNEAPNLNLGGYSYSKPSLTVEPPPEMDSGGYSYSKPDSDSSPVPDKKPDFHGYHYNKPTISDQPHTFSYGHSPPSYDHESNYPELIFDKPHGDMEDNKSGSETKDNDMGMMPPPPQADMAPDTNSGVPMDDHGFPPDFSDFKFHHDFDDHDFFHHHHHPTTTTTTTTESPRVNRFSYYYLGKKLYYLPLYFSVYFVVYVGSLIIKAVLRHKIVYPNSWRPDGTTNRLLTRRSVDFWDLSNENLHELTGRVTKAIAEAAEKYINRNLQN